MAYQSVFKRYELKYLLTQAQKQAVLEVLARHMLPDQYGQTTIRNIYFDTENYRLIRRSIEKPLYKEKLRLRSYSQLAAEEPAFVELKKKYDGVVYKRRIKMPEKAALNWLCHGQPPADNSQIAREIDYFSNFYRPLRPKVFLSYDRIAYYAPQHPNLRITFDDNILFRQDDLSLSAEIRGTPILGAELTLMEIKSAGGIPLWLTQALTENRIYKTSFSKYGTAYQMLMKQEAIPNGQHF